MVFFVIESTVAVDADTADGHLVLIMKWGGELTPLGKYQSEQLGQMFRCMYPGSNGASAKKGHGLLRLHSTFRHDLKIYASDEGRVQTTAAAFAKVCFLYYRALLMQRELNFNYVAAFRTGTVGVGGRADSHLGANGQERQYQRLAG